MIPANKDQSYLIKENEQDYWHVEITRKTVDPANAKNIISNSFVQVFDNANFNKIFRPERLGAKAKNLKAACLIDESRIIHNPELVEKVAPKSPYHVNDDLGKAGDADLHPAGNHDDEGGYKNPLIKKSHKKR